MQEEHLPRAPIEPPALLQVEAAKVGNPTHSEYECECARGEGEEETAPAANSESAAMTLWTARECLCFDFRTSRTTISSLSLTSPSFPSTVTSSVTERRVSQVEGAQVTIFHSRVT